ncbi:hypothetical protein M0R72_15835 [Candidatus Pacearchaeota archaeon]|jgi:hypothetical protein|nr:hypothetical protein [Candidatus Pacearchaeota archaeon]
MKGGKCPMLKPWRINVDIPLWRKFSPADIGLRRGEISRLASEGWVEHVGDGWIATDKLRRKLGASHTHLDRRSNDVLDFIRKNGPVSPKRIRDDLGLSKNGWNIPRKNLLSKGLIKRIPEGQTALWNIRYDAI